LKVASQARLLGLATGIATVGSMAVTTVDGLQFATIAVAGVGSVVTFRFFRRAKAGNATVSVPLFVRTVTVALDSSPLDVERFGYFKFRGFVVVVEVGGRKHKIWSTASETYQEAAGQRNVLAQLG